MFTEYIDDTRRGLNEKFLPGIKLGKTITISVMLFANNMMLIKQSGYFAKTR